MSLSSAKKSVAVLAFLSVVPFATAVSAQEIADGSFRDAAATLNQARSLVAAE